MWAQMIKTRPKPGQEDEARRMPQEMEQRFGQLESDFGPQRIIYMQDENDPGAFVTIIFFESEAKAREYEGSDRQHEIRKRLNEVWDESREFTDFNVLYEVNR